MNDSDTPSPAKRAGAAVALLTGGAALFLAATSPIAWGMVLGSGVELGGAAGARWLMNLTEGLVALGVLAGGRLVDRDKLAATLMTGVVALGVGALIGWRGHESASAVLIGLGVLASFGAGLLMSAGVVVLATRSRTLPGLVLGVAHALGVVAVELIWGSGSMFALSRGAEWVLSQVAWIGPLAGAAGGALIFLADRLSGPVGEGDPGRLPFFGARRAGRSVKATESGAFWTLVALALVASFVGLMAQRAGAALSLIGVPENSFVSGVLVGYTFALARAGGVAAGGLVHDLLGPRAALAMTALALAITQLVLSRFTGYENPWHALVGSVGAACGLAVTVVPIAVVFLLGRRHLGFHFGFLYLAVAFGNVMVLPLRPTVEAHPQLALSLSAGVCVVLAVLGARIRAPEGSDDDEAPRAERKEFERPGAA